MGETAAEEEEEEEEGEGEEEEDTGAPTTLEATLSHLGLAELTEVFLKEQIDFDSLVSHLKQTDRQTRVHVYSCSIVPS